MGNIFFSRILILTVLFSIGQTLFGQEPYYVFKKKGEPAINTDKVLQRGSVFSKKDTLYMGEEDYLLLVNKNGTLFEINKPNKYAYSSVLDHRRRLEDDSFTKKYFVYIWKEYTNQLKRKQEAGVVYREERNIKLESPVDSIKLFSSKVQFSWKNNTDKKKVHFFLRDLETGHLTKLGLTSNNITLYRDNLLLKSGQAYEWSVSTSSFPNLNKLKFNKLSILSKENYEKLEKEMTAHIKEFKSLNFSEEEIEEAICAYYKFCKI